jgi:hypothetical protein
MSSVHGITVFGGTFPAEIWHSLYSNGGVPCEEFEEPDKSISWAPYYGNFTQSGPSSDSGGGTGGGKAPPPGSAAVGGYDPSEYDPNAYAPGAGQEPAPLPPPPPSVSAGGGATAGSGK